jgi:hypothetical protein
MTYARGSVLVFPKLVRSEYACSRVVCVNSEHRQSHY